MSAFVPLARPQCDDVFGVPANPVYPRFVDIRCETAMRKQMRLRKSRDFAAARRGGRSWSDKLLVLIARRADGETCRFGFSVSKRVGNAVARNCVKRRLRETARQDVAARIEGGWDFVVIARKDAADADGRRLSRSLMRLFRRAKLLDAPPAVADRDK